MFTANLQPVNYSYSQEIGVVDGSLQMAMQKGKKKKGSKEDTQWTWKELVIILSYYLDIY